MRGHLFIYLYESKHEHSTRSYVINTYYAHGVNVEVDFEFLSYNITALNGENRIQINVSFL